jgi:hypothetical protein
VTDTLERTDTTSIEALDFEKCCEVRLAVIMGGKIVNETPCDKPAAWVGNYPCCGHLSILCHHHTFEDPSTFYCLPCKRDFPISALVGLRPLK